MKRNFHSLRQPSNSNWATPPTAWGYLPVLGTLEQWKRTCRLGGFSPGRADPQKRRSHVERSGQDRGDLKRKTASIIEVALRDMMGDTGSRGVGACTGIADVNMSSSLHVRHPAMEAVQRECWPLYDTCHRLLGVRLQRQRGRARPQSTSTLSGEHPTLGRNRKEDMS